LNEDVEVNVKFILTEDRDQWERMNKNMAVRHNLKDQDDFNTIDTTFAENIAIKDLDTITIAYTIPANSIVETGENSYWDEIVFRSNGYDKKLYYDGNKLKLYNNNTKKKEKAIFKTKKDKKDSWTRFFLISNKNSTKWP
jgi:hypothetical protein